MVVDSHSERDISSPKILLLLLLFLLFSCPTSLIQDQWKYLKSVGIAAGCVYRLRSK